ncbi:hypothetical protein KSS87_012572 [Heliosperma pusillum]|nr:hypothetical protein KSS87_012572 [Heliosperma pusillum]
MAITLGKLRSTLQSTIRNRCSANIIRRSFSSSSHSDQAYEAEESNKWEKITYLGIVSCTAMTFWILSKGHPHFDEPPVSNLLFLVLGDFVVIVIVVIVVGVINSAV